MLKIAHRGSTIGTVIDRRGNINYHKFHENSLLSYKNAIDQKFDMVEADVILTKDNQLIMHHDVNIGSAYIKDLTYEEIKEKKSYIVTFGRFCREIIPNIKTILDIKGDNNTALQMIDFFNKNNEIVIDNLYFTSFNHNQLITLHNYNKMFKIGVNYDSVLLKEEKEFLINLLNLSFVSIWWGNLHQTEIDFYKKLNIKIFSWTNDNYITHRLIPTDIDGIITNYYF